MEKNKFQIAENIEQNPFTDVSFVQFFEDWCKKNDKIIPQIVSRDEWEKQNEVLQNKEKNQLHVFIPEDLKLWEMVGIMEAIDHDTFKDKPEKQNERKDEIEKLGKKFQNVAIYIAQRLDVITEGRDIAEALTLELYEYGLSLTERGKSGVEIFTDEIKEKKLSSDEMNEAEAFLIGGKLVQSRKEKSTNENDEDIRRKTLVQFFRVSRKAFQLESQSENHNLSLPNEGLSPWQSSSPIHSEFVRKIEASLKKEIETPKSELTNSIFDRGLELLRKNILPPLANESSSFDSVKKIFSFWEKGEVTLSQSLKIDKLKKVLDQIRKTGDITSITKKEKEIVDKIQDSVSAYKFEGAANNPAEILVSRELNCVGGSILGGALLAEVGIPYLVGDVPEHSILVVAWSDDTVEWRDMIVPRRNQIITDEMLEGNEKEEGTLMVSEVAEMIKNPQKEVSLINISGNEYRNKFDWIAKGQRQYLKMYSPAVGHKFQTVSNAGSALIELGQPLLAIEALKQALAIDSEDTTSLNGMGDAMMHLGRYDDAVVEYQKAIRSDIADPGAYYGLGNALLELGENNEAILSYKQAINLGIKKPFLFYDLGNALFNAGRNLESIDSYKESIAVDPQNPLPYYGLGKVLSKIGNFEDSISAYRSYISLADPVHDTYYILNAKEMIDILEIQVRRDKIKKTT